MNIIAYRQKKLQLAESEPSYRIMCGHCRQPDFSCYCPTLAPFDPKMKFVILSHPLEYHKRIATGRMSYLSLRNSHLIEGEDYSRNLELNTLLHDPRYYPVMLYPGVNSRDLTLMNQEARAAWIPEGKKPAVIVIDGTWNTARKMVRLSENIKNLPRICFTPPTPSNFRIRKQPKDYCYSTIEAIHHTVELIGEACGFPVADRGHDILLKVFNRMIDRQIELAHCGKPDRRALRGRA